MFPLSYGDMLLLLTVFSVLATGLLMKGFYWLYYNKVSREVDRDLEEEYNSWSR